MRVFQISSKSRCHTKQNKQKRNPKVQQAQAKRQVIDQKRKTKQPYTIEKSNESTNEQQQSNIPSNTLCPNVNNTLNQMFLTYKEKIGLFDITQDKIKHMLTIYKSACRYSSKL